MLLTQGWVPPDEVRGGPGKRRGPSCLGHWPVALRRPAGRALGGSTARWLRPGLWGRTAVSTQPGSALACCGPWARRLPVTGLQDCTGAGACWCQAQGLASKGLGTGRRVLGGGRPVWCQTWGQDPETRTPHLAGGVGGGGEERAAREQGWGRPPSQRPMATPRLRGLNLPSRAPSSSSPRQAALVSDLSGSCSGGKAGPDGTGRALRGPRSRCLVVSQRGRC